jgi:hypothetical protein
MSDVEMTTEEEAATEITELEIPPEEELLLVEHGTEWIALGDIDTETFVNPRGDVGDLTELKQSLLASGVLVPLSVVIISPTGILDEDNQAEAVLLLDGQRRLAAMRELHDGINEHNERVARDGGFDDLDSTYLFVVDDGKGNMVPNPDVIPQAFSEQSCSVSIARAWSEELQSEMLVRAALINEKRESMTDYDRYCYVCRLSELGMRQVDIGKKLTRAQAWVSGAVSVKKNGSSVLITAIKEGKVSLRRGFEIAKHNKREQAALVAGKAPAKKSTFRSSREIYADVVAMSNPEAYVDVDEAHRQMMIRTFRYIMGDAGVTLEQLMYPPEPENDVATSTKSLLDLIPEARRRAPKAKVTPKKPATKKAPKKAAPKKAAPKKDAPKKVAPKAKAPASTAKPARPRRAARPRRTKPAAE